MLDHRHDLPDNSGPAYGMWLVLIYLAMVPMAIYFLIGNLT
jgi:hypothetical protein